MTTIEREFFREIERFSFDVPDDYYDNCTNSEVQLSGRESNIFEILDSLYCYQFDIEGE